MPKTLAPVIKRLDPATDQIVIPLCNNDSRCAPASFTEADAYYADLNGCEEGNPGLRDPSKLT